MKLALAYLALALTVFGLGLSFFSLLSERYPELADYERLWRVKDNLPQADYKDGARYLAAALELRSIEQLLADGGLVGGG